MENSAQDTDRPVENQVLIAPSNVRNPFVTISLYGPPAPLTP
ncbi:hypothetical protein WCP94_001437 [Bilophila wadsworthia]